MSLSDLASLGSFVSGVAVLFSFVFLALQLRQGNVNQRALIQSERTASVRDGLYRRMEPHLLDAWLKGSSGDASMTREEVEMYLTATYAGFLNFENTYLQSRSGTIHADAWEIAIARLQPLLASPGYRVSWKKCRHRFGGDFAQVVDQIVAKARLSGWEDPFASWASDVAEEKRLAAN